MKVIKMYEKSLKILELSGNFDRMDLEVAYNKAKQRTLKNVSDTCDVKIIDDAYNYVLEDMSGWSVSEVKTYMNLLGLKAYYEGYGVLTNQSISPGTTINKDDEITITFSSS